MNQRLYSNIIGLPVVRRADGMELARVFEVIIDPNTGHLEAFWVKCAAGRKVLLTRDIAEWKLKIYIEEAELLSEPEDLIRLTPILAKEIYLYGLKVETIEGVYLGKVYDFSFDLISYKLVNLYIFKKILFFPYDRRVINSSEIIKITREAIVVRSDLRLIRWRKKKVFDLEELAISTGTEAT